MTQRLPLYVTASLLAHLALLLVWHAESVAPIALSEPGLQISLVQAVRQLAEKMPDPGTASTPHTSTTRSPPVKARHTHRLRQPPASIPASLLTASAAAATDVATTPTGQTPTPKLSDDTAARLQAEMRIAFNRYFNYPAMALRHGWKGVVKISLRLEPDGHLSEVRLIQSSGHSALDAAAVASAQRIPPLLDAVAWLQGNSHVILLPVEYRLIDG
jgi:protein TonB